MRNEERKINKTTDKRTEDGRIARSIQGLVQAFKGKKQFSGSWEEGVDARISIFETHAKMCDLTQSQKITAMAIMLACDAFKKYSSNGASCDSYEKKIKSDRRWYHSV